MGQIILVKHKQAYDTEENWKTNNPILLPGQLAYSSDKYGKYKIGDGTAHWNDLEYCNNVYQIKSRTALPQSNTTIANINDYKVNYSFININVYNTMPTSTTGTLVYSITIPTYLIGSFKDLDLKSGNTFYGTLTFGDSTISIIGQTVSSYDIYGIK